MATPNHAAAPAVAATSSQGSPALKLDGIRCEVAGRTLLDDVTLAVAPGESVAVMGPSGSGKTTLLMCALGLVRPHEGAVLVAGGDITRLRRRALAEHRRRHMGMVFQFGELLPELTPVENVAVAAQLAGTSLTASYQKATELLAAVNLPNRDAPTSTLSGGERQRVAVARALINEPTVLLADEPTGSLDAVSRDAVASLLFDVPKRWGCALVVVTHDLDVAAKADRQLSLSNSRLTPVATTVGEMA
ncbi:ABC transporter ATP-binding protein [Streptomyces phaeochromogenes]|uniref:ABC transporter ATP-binding protein n=1 Tax=Streptomyces phaeochromogenes TaxID=1923 RepID=UPI002E2A876D|nr:ABC transporter ATP-binding protein [Streptomyces phaeochromogenes]